MSKMFAFVGIYTGKEIDANVAATIAINLVKLGVIKNTDDITIQAFDENDMARSFVKAVAANEDKDALIIKMSAEDEALKSAIVVIGTFFAESLKTGEKTSNYARFATNLMLHSHDESIYTAIKVIATSKGKVSKEVLQRYRMSGAALHAVKDVYGTLSAID